MAANPKPISVTEKTELLRLLDIAEESPLILEHNGVLFRLSRADQADDSDADHSREEVLKILDQTLGSWSDLDADQLVEEVYEARRAGSRPDDRP